MYGYLKQYAPKGALPHIAQLEDTVSSYSYPALAKIQDRSDSILKSLDGQVPVSPSHRAWHLACPAPAGPGPALPGPCLTAWGSAFPPQVDYVAKQAGGYYGSASDTVSSTHKDNMQRFHSSRQTYFSKIHETVEARPALPCCCGCRCSALSRPARHTADSCQCPQYVKQHGLVGSARATADTLMGQVKEAQKATEKQAGYATEKVKETWSSFLNLPLGAPPGLPACPRLEPR